VVLPSLTDKFGYGIKSLSILLHVVTFLLHKV